MTKDEILFKWWNKQNQEGLSTNDCIIEAMKEYANQEIEWYKERIKELEEQKKYREQQDEDNCAWGKDTCG